MKWVVLSDLHMKFNNFDSSQARKKLIEELEKKKGSISFVLITGDCFLKNDGDLTEILGYLAQLANACGIEKDKVILCPGNHDIEREIKKRKSAISKYREDGKTLPDIEVALLGHGKFKELHALAIGEEYKPFNIKCVDNFRIITVDSCLLSLDDMDYGHLNVNFPELFNLEIEDDSKINIVIMHHGVEWLQPEAGRRFQHWLVEHNVKMVFCGHNHTPGMNVLTEAIPEHGIARDGIPQFTCGCALADSYSNPVFLLAQYNEDIDSNNRNTENKNIQSTLYEYQKNSNWKVSSNILRSFESGVYRESNTSGLIKNMYDIPIVYKSIYDLPEEEIVKEIENGKKLYYYGLRGKRFLRGNSKIADAAYNMKNQIELKILVSNPYNINIEKRLKQVEDFSERDELENHWKTIYENIKQLRDDFPKYHLWGIRFHNQPLYFRFIMTDEKVYFGFYTEQPSSLSAMYCYSNKSVLYGSLSAFFELEWENAKPSFPRTVPDRCSFVLDRFEMKPSLVINLTSDCNMNCKYCPDGGENLARYKELCGIKQVKYLLTAYANYYKENEWAEKKVVRITGGEPFLEEERLIETLKHARKEDYEKIVLCTNGLLLKDSYEKYPRVWESIKKILLLKISLDSLKSAVFKKLTSVDALDVVMENIKFAKDRGFKIELNLVATKLNVGEIEDVFDYVQRMKLVGVKVLTVNDFGDRIKPDNVEQELNALIEKLRRSDYEETGLYVHNNKGIYMKRFIHNGCTLTIVDHMNRSDSVTPRRTYSEACLNCDFYPESYKVHKGNKKPCATGIMSLTMRADGMLSFCRMRENRGFCLEGKSMKEVQEMLQKELKKFKKCYHYALESEKDQENEKI